ncbi:MAG: hypothetical protein ACKN9E_14780 [Microcystaceae cyanobacterium]
MLKNHTDSLNSSDLPSQGQTYGATGAIIGQPSPTLPPLKYNMAKRDELFAKLQHLRGEIPSQTIQQQILEIEQQLNAMLNMI